MTYHYPGEIVGDFKAMRHKRKGAWLWRCLHCRAEKTASFVTMERTGMKHCKCRKPLLTPAQQRVADLFEQGHRNCEIAELLGIDHRTVSCHSSAIYERRLQEAHDSNS
jgi:DNA-binding NarL/FixJ family response regulator